MIQIWRLTNSQSWHEKNCMAGSKENLHFQLGTEKVKMTRLLSTGVNYNTVFNSLISFAQGELRLVWTQYCTLSPCRGITFLFTAFFSFSFDIITQGQDIQLVSMDSVEPASLCMESNMEDNSGLDLICARNSLSNGLLSEINPTTLSNLERLKIEQIIGSLGSYYGVAEDNVD